MWRDLNICVSVLAPGPKGPAATQHLVNLNEGVQECEARIVLEKALSDPAMKAKVGGDLAGRCQALLDERMRAMQRCFCMLNYWREGVPAQRRRASTWPARWRRRSRRGETPGIAGFRGNASVTGGRGTRGGYRSAKTR